MYRILRYITFRRFSHVDLVLFWSTYYVMVTRGFWAGVLYFGLGFVVLCAIYLASGRIDD